MISKLKLKFGSSPSDQSLEIDTTPVTVFVGPNNSGKSKILIEIENYCRNGITSSTDVLLQEIIFSELENPINELANLTLKPKDGEFLRPYDLIFGNGNYKNNINKDSIIKILQNPNSMREDFCRYYMTIKTLRLDGERRIHLINESGGGDLQDHPQNTLQILFRNNHKRKEVRRIIYESFKKYFVVDPTNLGLLRIRLSDIPPKSETQERGLDEESVDFHNKAIDIRFMSDGVKAFAGIIIEIIAGDPKVILIDEPEAFLHPSLATNLGKEISKSITHGSKNLFVSTHSSNFLMGCIQSGNELNIVRLTYSNNIPTARILPYDKVLKLMRHP